MTNKVPNIRFKGFTDDWEQRKLSSGLREYTDRVIVEDDKEYYQISVRNNFGGITLRGSKMGNKIGRKRQAKINLTKYPQTLIFTRQTVEQGGIGWVEKYCDGAIVTENMPTISLDTSVFSKYFLTNLFQTKIFYKNAILDNIEGGSAQIAIHESKFLSSTLLFPNLDEQEKIGSFFKQIDETITLHQRKCEQTKELKKFMLQKMFPKKGEKNPEIRFPGFTDDWEQRKLGELVTFSKGSGYSKGDLLKEGTPIILYGRLYTKYETVISNVDTFVEPKGKSVFSKGGEVIVPGSGETAEDISIASVVEESGVLLGGDLNIITPPKEINSAFLAISISNGKPHKDMAKMAQGKSVVHLHNSDLAKIDFPFPIYEEQCRISNQFAELDNLITLHQRKCEQLKELKKFMLQNMFPKKG